MRISDTLDQLLRSLLVSGSADDRGAAGDDQERPGPSAPPAAPDDASAPLALDLEAAAAEVAIKRAHELDEPEPSARGDTTAGETTLLPAKRDPGDLAGLEASAGAVENLGLGFHLGAAIERIALAAGEGSEGRLKLREAKWLIERYISLLEQRPVGADLHASSLRLARTGETIAGLHEITAELAREAEPVPEPVPQPATEPVVEPVVEPAGGVPQPVETGAVEAVATEAREQIVHELPSIGREIFVTTVRAGVAFVTITVLVLVLTLIAQWR